MLLLVSLLLALEVVQGLFYGPYFFPTGDTSDPIYINFGEHNTTHAFFNMFVTGDYWFGFGFASGSGCTAESALVNECYMKDTEALVFGDYASADPTKRFTAKEYILGTTAYPHSPEQEISQNYLEVDEVTQQCFGGTCDYTVRIRRPYDPSAYGDRNAYQITYPLAGSFCFLWAQGDGIFFSPSSTHENNGAKCIAFGGTTVAPTPTPSYNPIPNPTIDPTPKPTRYPSVQGDTARPTIDPTVSPTAEGDTRPPTGEPSSSPSDAPSSPAIVGIPTLCISDPLTSDQVLELKLYLDFDNDLLTIEIFGPDDQWFGVGFGEQMANTYAYIVSGENLDITEHKLAFHKE
eukprot:8315_1